MKSILSIVLKRKPTYAAVFLWSVTFLLFTFVSGKAQMVFTSGAGLTQTQNFNGMSGATLPAGFAINASNAVTQTATSLNSSSSGGSYKFISGADNAIGILNSGSYTSGKSITLQLTNNTGSPITKLDISFNYEKYRTGSRAWTWTLAGSSGTVTGGGLTYPADAANTTSIFPPLQTAATASITGINIPNVGTYTLTWTLTGNGGNTNGQGLGIDDLSITATIPVISSSLLSDMGDICINTTSNPQSFTITGTNLSNQNVTISSALTAYTFSTTAGGTYSNPLIITQSGGAFSQNVFVKFSPLLAQAYHGNISISGGGASTVTTAATGDGVAPTVTVVTNSPVCEKSDLSLDGSGSVGNGILSYQWSGPNSYSSVIENPIINTVDFSQAGNYTLLVTDGNGCQDSKTVSVVVNQVITAPVNVTVGTDVGFCTASNVNLGTPLTSSNCTVTNIVNDAPIVFPKGITTVTWSATVGANTFTATQMVTVTDDKNPSITAPANITVNTDAGACTASGVNLGTATASDNCSFIISNDAPLSFNIGATTVTWIATDGAGNTATSTQMVTVTDNQNPIITAPSNITVNTDAGVCTASGVNLGTATASDNCSFTISNDAPVSFNIGTTTVTWTATDGAGNTATSTQIVTVTDNQNPIITAPSNITVNTDAGACTASGVNLGTATASDNCSFIISNDAPLSFNIGATTVTWTATDGAGNTATSTQTVTVTDNQNPIITAPSNITVDTDAGSCTASSVNLGTATASDNCSFTISNDAPLSFNIGTTTVTWTATDGAGNTATSTQTVTVTDNQNPIITAPSNIAVDTDAGSCTASSVNLGTATASDNCSFTISNDTPVSFNIGTTTVTWTATDGAGNTATSTQMVTVTDNQNPIITAPSNITVNTDAGACTASGVNLGTATASDNCSFTISNDAPLSFNVGTTTVTWTATDGAGNTTTATQSVTVNSAVIPEVTISANTGNTICTGNTVIFTATPIHEGLTPHYQWTVNGNNVGLDSDTYTNSTLINADLVTCFMTSSLSCAVPLTVSDNITMVVNPIPSITITANPSNATVCNGDNITLTATGGISYSWNGGVNNGVAFSPLLSDVYTVEVTDGNGCTNTSSMNISVQTCSDVVESDNTSLVFDVYPNPSNGEFNIKSNFTTKAEILVFDLLGHLRYKGIFEKEVTMLDLKNLGNGVFAISIESESKKLMKLITIE